MSLAWCRSCAGDGPDLESWGLEAERGSWWCRGDDVRESGWRDEDGRWVTK